MKSFSRVLKKVRKTVRFPKQAECKWHDRFSVINTADPYASAARDGSTRVRSTCWLGLVQFQVECRQHDDEWHIVQGYWHIEIAVVLR